jgi:hypothetical protein
MISIRRILGAIGAVGTVGWGVLFTLASMMASSMTGADLFLGLSPFAVFIFYVVIAIRPCQARTAFLIGTVLHVPLVFVIIHLLRVGHEAPIFAAALGVGTSVWLIYVRQLARHKNTA